MVVMSSRTRSPWAKDEEFRYTVNLSASYYYSNWQSCEIVDVSRTGATIRTRQILMGHDKVVLQITHGNKSATVDTNVLHQSGMKAHLVFDRAGSEERTRFLDLLNSALYERSKARAKKFGIDL